MRRSGLPAAVGVGLAALAFALAARIEWPWAALVWVALVPWLAVLDRAASRAAALRLGFAMSVGFVLVVFLWFATAVRTYTGLPWGVGLAVLVVMGPLVEPQFVTVALARHLVRRGGAGAMRTAVTTACVWVATEWAAPKLFADTLGHGLYPSLWMRQAADVAGAPGLTLVLVLANECVLAAGRAAASGGLRRALAPAAAVAGIVVALLGYGAMRCRELAAAARAGEPFTVGVVQADIGQYGRLADALGTFDAVRIVLEAHFALSDEAAARVRPDLLVWPETVYPTTFGTPKSPDGAAFDRAIGAFVGRLGIPLVFGSYDREGADEYNAAIFLEPPADGRIGFETYRKAWLFPLIERVPALLDAPAVRRWLPWLGAWKPGPGGDVVRLRLRSGRALRIAPLICYDALDPGIVRRAVRGGAEMILTLSNDSWFDAGAGPRLHLLMAIFRSLETRRPQVRATNTGISAVITPAGEITAMAGTHERTVLAATVTPVGDVTAPMVVWGDWLGPVALVTGAALVAISGRPRPGRPAS